MKKRIPLIMMCWTAVMIINFIYVRVSASGYNLLAISASTGSSVAGRYTSSLVWMIIAGCAFAAALIWKMKTGKKNGDK